MKILIIVVLSITLIGCISLRSNEPAQLAYPTSQNASPKSGEVFLVEPIRSYSHRFIRFLFWWQGFSDLKTERGIALYRIGYWTTAVDGRIVKASGLIALPQGDTLIRGVIGWQHGTATLKSAAPSVPDPENGLLAAAAFAGHGYLMIAPDYPGFGLSEEPHSYYHTASIVNSVVDCLRATQVVIKHNQRHWPESLFLTGFSQGGHASLATQRELELSPIEGLTVTATASVAGPVDLAGVSFPYAMKADAVLASLYIAWSAVTYARDYQQPIEALLKAPWSETAAALFDGTNSGHEIAQALPSKPRDMLTNESLGAFDNNQAHWFLEKIRENSIVDQNQLVYGWVPQAPIQMYYGETDLDVSAEDAHVMAQVGKSVGADVEAISVGVVEHDPAIYLAAPLLRNWFDQLSLGKY
ncbi:MAG: lipase family protein [Pseudomonadota bacterium]